MSATGNGRFILGGATLCEAPLDALRDETVTDSVSEAAAATDSATFSGSFGGGSQGRLIRDLWDRDALGNFVPSAAIRRSF